MALRTKLILLLIPLMGALISAPTGATPLQEVYDQAQPGEGYDKLLVLDPGEMYTGYMVVYPGVSCAIHGNGALITLDQTGSIAVPSWASLDIDGCVITGGYYGLNYDYPSNSTVENCTIVDNSIGVWCGLSQGTQVTIKNCIIADNSQYGIACRENLEPAILYNDVWRNVGGNYMAFCPG